MVRLKKAKHQIYSTISKQVMPKKLLGKICARQVSRIVPVYVNFVEILKLSSNNDLNHAITAYAKYWYDEIKNAVPTLYGN